MRVSVIVPVRNGASDVRVLLGHLDRQTLPRRDFEVVIADDGSTDAEIADFASADDSIRVLSAPPENSYAARNRAVRASTADVLAFCDADCRPEPEWLERGLHSLRDTDILAGRFKFDLPSPRNVWALIDMDGSKDHEHQVRLGLAETANLFLRRELFDRVGGFDGSVPEYGDFEFVQRCVAQDYRLSYAADVVVCHPVRSSGNSLLRALWKYNRGYGVHEGRAGRIPDAVKLRSWVPVVQTARGRRRWNRSLLGPDRQWLRQNGVEPRTEEVIRSLPVMYLVIPYLRSLAQLRGWLDGRRLRSAG